MKIFSVILHRCGWGKATPHLLVVDDDAAEGSLFVNAVNRSASGFDLQARGKQQHILINHSDTRKGDKCVDHLLQQLTPLGHVFADLVRNVSH